MVRGEGAYVWDQHGKRYLDGLAGLFTSQLGHGRTELGRRRRSRRARSPTSPCGPTRTPAPSSWPSGSRRYAPGDLNRIFFTSGGSEAVESAWKLARQYFRLTGQPMRTKVISRDIAYHGTTMGRCRSPASRTSRPRSSPSCRGHQGAQHQLLPGSLLRRRRRGLRALGRRRDRAGHRAGGSDTGCRRLPRAGAERRRLLPAAPGVLRPGAQICDRHGVLLVSDEVICAFGRLGDTGSAPIATATSPTSSPWPRD
jgi:adenosylmethionine-8-amino-7-oxononanoate aminotransferase